MEPRIYSGESLGETRSLAERCVRVGEYPSAQFKVFLLPEEFTVDVSPTGRLDDTIPMQRVVKIPLQPHEALSAIRTLNIQSPDINEKLEQLSDDAHRISLHAATWMLGVEGLARLFGYPRLVVDRSTPGAIYNKILPYTQDFVTPLPSFFTELDIEHNEAGLRRACEAIDAYIDAQLMLCTYGLFDCTFKLANCGMSQEMDARFVRSQDEHRFLQRFRIFDPYEFTSSLSRTLDCISRKAWHETIGKPVHEFGLIHPLIQQYFMDACDARITVEAIDMRWCSNLQPRRRFNTIKHAEVNFPEGLCDLLAKKT